MSTDSDDDRRAHARAPVTLIVEYGSAAELVEDYTSNLSIGGTFVHTEREFTVGTEIDLVLSFPGLLRPLQLSGVVRRTASAPNETGVGIEFKGYDDVARSQLAQVLAAIEAGDPDFVGRAVRVLLAEDNLHVARLIREGLSQGARRQSFPDDVVFEFYEAATGLEALEFLEAGQKYDLFVIDVFLPMLDGPSVIKRIKAHTDHADVPLIAISSGGDAAKEQAEAAGCDLFMDKPFRLRELIELVQSILTGPEDQPGST